MNNVVLLLLAFQSPSEPADLSAVPIDEIVVVSQLSLLEDEPAPGVALDREAIESMPHFGDDFYRAIKVLPGASGNDFAAGFNVRGAFHREVLVRLDGLEIFEPFHLKDFQGAFSILDPEVVASVELLPGAFPARYGDRSAAVLDMTSSRPRTVRSQLGISFSNVWLGSSGTFHRDKGRWLASARRGYLDLVLSLAEQGNDDDGQPSPSYWDAYVKVDYDLAARHRLSLNALAAHDTLDFTETEPGERSEVRTGYGNGYVWLSEQSILGEGSFVDTVLSAGRVDRRRFGDLVETDEVVTLDDYRDMTFLGLRQDWSLELSGRHYLETGFELRSFEVDYDYSDSLQRDNPIDDPRFLGPSQIRRFRRRDDGEQWGAWISDRLRVGSRLTVQLGLRWDRQELTDDEQTSPRLNLLYDLGRGGALRLGWGRFFQSQRPYELGAEFGETELQPAQRADHFSLGWERQFARLGLLHLEAYRRREREPHRRYETLFDPFDPIPQTAIDLVQIAPDEVVSEGLEIYLRDRRRGKLDWWLGYTYSSIDDRLDGIEQRRYIDQPHAFNASLTWSPGRKWTLSGVYRYHTGWPTTAIAAEAFFDERGGRIVYDIGSFYGERLEDYHSLDVRLSRRATVGRDSTLTFFLDIQNLSNRENRRGLDLDEVTIRAVDGRYPVSFEETDWLPILPSFGIRWEF